MERYRLLLVGVKENRIQLQNENFDIGQPTRLGEYRMADDTYSKLLERIDGAADKVSPELRLNILAFFKDSQPESEKARTVLAALKSQP